MHYLLQYVFYDNNNVIRRPLIQLRAGKSVVNHSA